MKLAAHIAPPIAAEKPVVTRRHGHDDVDPYAWLRDPNWQEVVRAPEKLRPEIRAYLEAENAYLETVMAPTKGLQETLFQEMKGRIKEDDSSVPSPDGPFDYYDRYRTGGQHEIVCRRPRGDKDFAREQILIDGDEEAKGHAYFVLGDAAHSYDHKLLAYSTDTAGSEYYTIRVREIATGRELSDVIADTAGGVAWSPQNDGFYYVRYDDHHRPRTALFHKLGTRQADDTVIYDEKNPGYFVSVWISEEDDYLLVDASDSQTNEVRFRRADRHGDKLQLVAKRRPETEYSVSQYGKTFLIVTNANGAEDSELVTAPIAKPGPDNWKPLIPHRKGRLLLGIDVTKRHLAWAERENALPSVWVSSITEKAPGRIALGEPHAIAFKEEAYSLGMSSGYEFDTDDLRFYYSSPTTPAQEWNYNMASRARTLLKTQEVPSGHDPADYVTRRVHARGHDGAEIPITILHHKSTPIDGTAPALLYGYGSYGHSMHASFGIVRLSLVDRGFIHALAHVRGGMDKGYHWYREGRRFEKKNTFTDFIACAERLVELGYAAPGRIVAQGGSAGGMLVGAVANMAPEKFLGFIGEVPFVDVLNTMWDGELPLTPPEWPEWGNPIEDAQACRYIRSYSPYDNVAAHAYPHILATAGLSDPRVTYWEPAKWVAMLRARKTGDGVVLFKTHMEAGHGGASGRFDSLKDDALAYAFALMIAGG